MIWNVMLLTIHLFALTGFVYLYRTAPCWMQRLVMAGMVAATVLIAASYLIDAIGSVESEWWGGMYIRTVAYAIEHIAILLYVFRLVYQQHASVPKGVQPWSKSSAHFRA